MESGDEIDKANIFDADDPESMIAIPRRYTETRRGVEPLTMPLRPISSDHFGELGIDQAGVFDADDPKFMTTQSYYPTGSHTMPLCRKTSSHPSERDTSLSLQLEMASTPSRSYHQIRGLSNLDPVASSSSDHITLDEGVPTSLPLLTFNERVQARKQMNDLFSPPAAADTSSVDESTFHSAWPVDLNFARLHKPHHGFNDRGAAVEATFLAVLAKEAEIFSPFHQMDQDQSPEARISRGEEPHRYVNPDTLNVWYHPIATSPKASSAHSTFIERYRH